MATFKTVGGKNYTLSSSITSTQTTITLSSFTLPVTDQAITMATAGTSIMYGTIQPGSTNSELISFTGVTQNANGTATLTGVIRGLDRETPYGEVSDFKLPHPGQSIFILSDAPQVFNSYTAKVNDETVEGKWTFPNDTNTPLIGASYVAPTIDNQVATKKYIDDIAIAGSPKATDSVYGITKLSVAAVSATDPIAVGTNDTRVPTQDENNALVGTSGTPSSTNKYVTNDDTSTTGAASKIVRANSFGMAAAQVLKSFYFGDGSDGAATISSNTTLTKDMNYTNLTVNTGITLNPGGYRIFVSGTLTISGTGKISRDGNNGVAGGQSGTIAGGAALATASLGGSGAGGTGAANGNGGTGGSLTNCLGSVGGRGSDGTPGGAPGGGAAAGTATAASPTISAPSFPAVLAAVTGSNTTGIFQGGSGGGGGGGFLSASGSGGTGGSGGGVILISAQTMNFAAADSVTAKGGNGGNGNGGGGGGGGGGGTIILVYSSMAGSTLVASSCVSGGTLGTGNSGTIGAAGTIGTIYSYLIS